MPASIPLRQHRARSRPSQTAHTGFDVVGLITIRARGCFLFPQNPISRRRRLYRARKYLVAGIDPAFAASARASLRAVLPAGRSPCRRSSGDRQMRKREVRAPFPTRLSRSAEVERHRPTMISSTLTARLTPYPHLRQFATRRADPSNAARVRPALLAVETSRRHAQVAAARDDARDVDLPAGSPTTPLPPRSMTNRGRRGRLCGKPFGITLANSPPTNARASSSGMARFLFCTTSANRFPPLRQLVVYSVVEPCNELPDISRLPALAITQHGMRSAICRLTGRSVA